MTHVYSVHIQNTNTHKNTHTRKHYYLDFNANIGSKLWSPGTNSTRATTGILVPWCPHRRHLRLTQLLPEIPAIRRMANGKLIRAAFLRGALLAAPCLEHPGWAAPKATGERRLWDKNLDINFGYLWIYSSSMTY